MKLGLTLLFLAGCTSASNRNAPDAGPGGYGNVVDAVLIPLLTANGLEPVAEDPLVLCRRLALDLTGLAPSSAEVAAHCVGHPAADMADYFMNKPAGANAVDGSPPYVWVNRRWWADQFMYDSGTNPASTHYSYVADLDALVGSLYSGQIKYDEFARRALGHPAFARRFGIFEANHDLVQIASQAFRVFLGREALPSEAEDFGNLWRGWSTQFMSEVASEAAYPNCPVTYDQLLARNGCRHYEVGLVGAQCGGVNQISCQSTVLGAGQLVPSASGFTAWSALSAADKAQLEIAGRLISMQPEFAEAAVDRALLKYLGWWKAGFYRPDFDVPAVRDALVKKLVADGFDVRKMEREIVTSMLYSQAAALRPGQLATVPIWAFGPSKLMYAEAWLDTVGQALGKTIGGCDFRFTGTNAPKIPGFYNFPLSSTVAKTFYFLNAQNLGGCPVASTHGEPSGLVPAVTRRVVLSQLCPGALKPAASATLPDLVSLAFAGVGRPASSAESKILIDRMSGVAGGVQPLADALCTSLFATATFNYY